MNLKDHWEQVFISKDTSKVSWFRDIPSKSLEFILKYTKDTNDSILDVGGGDSNLPLFLLKQDFSKISLLDISKEAVKRNQLKMKSDSNLVTWEIADVLEFSSSTRFNIWHDRAVFHFLSESEDQETYKHQVLKHLTQDGTLIISGFAAGGPSRCSGLDTIQLDEVFVKNLFGNELELVEVQYEDHKTPGGSDQLFFWGALKRS